jgi:hypothetical protein
MPEPAAPEPPRRHPLPALLVVVAATLALWWPLLDHDFTFGDYPLLREVRSGTFAEHLRDHTIRPLTRETTGREAAPTPPWRPGFHALVDVGNAVGKWRAAPDVARDPAPRGWFEVALALHALVAVALFSLLVAEGAGPWFAAAGALVVALAPALAETVGTPSTAYATLPCALFVLWAGRGFLQWLQGGRVAWLLAALLLYAYSFAFGEAGAALPLVLLAGLAVLGKSRFRSVGSVVLVAVLIGAAVPLYVRYAHWVTLRAIELTLAPRLRVAADAGVAFLGGLAGAGATAPADAVHWLLAALGLAWIALLASGRTRTRFYLAWAPLAALPFLGRSPTPALALPILVPLGIGLVLWLEERVRERGAALRLLALAPLVALAAWHGWRLPAALEKSRERGAAARGALESLRDKDLGGVIALEVQGAPPAMVSGLGDMVALCVPGAGGAKPEVRELGMVVRRPLAIFADPLFALDLTGVNHYRWDAGQRRLVYTTRSELIGGHRLLPRYAVSSELPELAGPDSGVPLWNHAPPGSELVVLAVVAKGDVYAVLRLGAGEPLDGAVWVDGVAAPLVATEDGFSAVRVGDGVHMVAFRVAAP